MTYRRMPSRLPRRFRDPFAELCRRLPGDAENIVLVLRKADAPLVSALANAYPGTTFHHVGAHRHSDDLDGSFPPNVVVNPLSTSAQRIDYLKRIPAPQAIVENLGRATTRARSFNNLFWPLADGGKYFALAISKARDDGHDLRTALERAAGYRNFSGARAALSFQQREFADCIDDLVVEADIATVSKKGTHLVKLRHGEAEDVLTKRLGPKWGTVLGTQGAYAYQSHAELTIHGDGPALRQSRTICVPELKVRRYNNVTCHHRELFTVGDLFIPDSFRLWMRPSLNHRGLTHSQREFDRIRAPVRDAPVREVEGEFFQFDTAYPRHFGHVTTEVISRYWGWLIAHALNPDIRPIVSLTPGHDEIPAFQAEIFTALEIPLTGIEYVTRDEAVKVSSLVAAMPQIENPHYLSEGMSHTWRKLFDGLDKMGLPPTDEPREKIFIYRRPSTKRNCHNAQQVDDFMVAHGFTLVYPEDMPYREQVRLFRDARIIAGYAGSGMFNMMFNPEATIIVIVSTGYHALNEYLFGSVNANTMHYFWGPADVPRPPDRFSSRAFYSDFRFPFETLGPELAELLR